MAAAPPAAGGAPSGREPAGRGRPESSPRRRRTPARREPCPTYASPPGGASLRQVRWRRRAAGWRRPGSARLGGQRGRASGAGGGRGKLRAGRGTAVQGGGGGDLRGAAPCRAAQGERRGLPPEGPSWGRRGGWRWGWGGGAAPRPSGAARCPPCSHLCGRGGPASPRRPRLPAAPGAGGFPALPGCSSWAPSRRHAARSSGSFPIAAAVAPAPRSPLFPGRQLGARSCAGAALPASLRLCLPDGVGLRRAGLLGMALTAAERVGMQRGKGCLYPRRMAAAGLRVLDMLLFGGLCSVEAGNGYGCGSMKI